MSEEQFGGDGAAAAATAAAALRPEAPKEAAPRQREPRSTPVRTRRMKAIQTPPHDTLKQRRHSGKNGKCL